MIIRAQPHMLRTEAGRRRFWEFAEYAAEAGVRVLAGALYGRGDNIVNFVFEDYEYRIDPSYLVNALIVDYDLPVSHQHKGFV